jgi:hypothetical protein
LLVRVMIAGVALVPACNAWRPAPPPEPIPTLALLPIHDPPNRSAVTGVFTFYSWIADTRAAVPTLVADAVREELARRGIRVVDVAAPVAPASLDEARTLDGQAALTGPALFLSIGKWEAQNVSFPEFVDVSIDATLLASPSGTIMWTTRGAAGPVATRGSSGLLDAYRRAAQQVAADLVGRWRPATTGSP